MPDKEPKYSVMEYYLTLFQFWLVRGCGLILLDSIADELLS